MTKLTCTQAQAWYEGVERNPDENAAFEAHILDCPACKARYCDPADAAAVAPGCDLFTPRDPMRTREPATAPSPSVVSPDDYPFLKPPARPGAPFRIGRYEVLQVLGRGGMGIVFLARDTALPREVAVKVMAPELADDPQARARFVKEAHAAALLNHPHVVIIHEVVADHEPPYLVTEYVRGPTLADRLRANPRLTLAEIYAIASQLAQALAAAHQAGLVHRDVKPGNILLVDDTPDGAPCVKVADFGLADHAGHGDLARGGVLAGTPAYMAPEQARGGPIDYRADLFALGSVLYELCTGHRPFDGGNTLVVLDQVKTATPTPIRKVNAAVPGWFVAVVGRLHAKKPGGRFQSAADVADAIERGRRGKGRLPWLGLLLAGAAAAGLVGVALWWALQPVPLNVALTRDAWLAYKAGDHDQVLAQAERCLKEFRGQATRDQQELEKRNAPQPDVAPSAEERAFITRYGLLNDVATCQWLMGRAHEAKGQLAEARKAYEAAQRYTFARCYDPGSGTYFSPALKAGDDLANLDEKNP